MALIEECVDVGVPVSMAYGQWTQFTEFPRFMHGVDAVEQIDDTHVRWHVSTGTSTRTWDAEIVEQVPDRAIVWRAVGGAHNTGEVRFEPIGAAGTRVHLLLQPDAWGQDHPGDQPEAARRRMREDLERFRALVESEDRPTGTWRGEVHEGRVVSSEGNRGAGWGAEMTAAASPLHGSPAAHPFGYGGGGADVGTGADPREEQLKRDEEEHAVRPGEVREDASPEIREGEREE